MCLSLSRLYICVCSHSQIYIRYAYQKEGKKVQHTDSHIIILTDDEFDLIESL